MQYDDRLATVLRQSGAGQRAARTQYRQLLDLLGRRKPVRGRQLAARAWARIGELGEVIEAPARARIVEEAGWHLTSPELVIHLAGDDPPVAAAALARARLSGEDWEALIPRLPIRARGFLRFRKDLPANAEKLLERLGVHDRGLPVPVAQDGETADNAPLARDVEVQANLPPTSPSEPPTETEDSDIGRLVKRIEAFQRARSAPAAESGDPRLPLGDASAKPEPVHIAAFDFTSDATGRIDWASEAALPMVEGAQLVGEDDGPPRAWLQRTPLSGAALYLRGASAVAGEWSVDAAPFFTDTGGAFMGYAGRFRRPAPMADSITSRARAEGEQIRQILHELRTPVNAIQGFAELIQQQLFGPVPNEYRAQAANIAGDSARILAGFDELDRLARLQSGALEIPEGSSDFADVIRKLTDKLQGVLAVRMAGFDHSIPASPCPVALGHAEAEAVAWRMLAALGGTLSAGEETELILECGEDAMCLRVHLSAEMMAQDDIFRSTARLGKGTLSAGAFGTGFALRLARAEARAVGGNLRKEGDWLQLTLPRAADSGLVSGLTPTTPTPSDRIGEQP